MSTQKETVEFILDPKGKSTSYGAGKLGKENSPN
jgi:hypothetical protein